MLSELYKIIYSNLKKHLFYNFYTGLLVCIGKCFFDYKARTCNQ